MRKASTKAIVYGVLLLAAVLFLAYSLKGTPAPSAGKPPRVATAGRARPASATGDERPVQAAPTDAALDRYQAIVTRNIFAPPAPPRPKQTAKGPTRRTPLVIPPIHPESVVTGPEPQSLEGWEFVGYYTLDGVIRGVLQNDNNQTAKELAVGESFLNYRVESVSPNDHGEMVLVCGRTRVSLKPPTDFAVVALSGATPQPAARQGPQPGVGPGGQPGMGPGRMGMGPGPGPGMGRMGRMGRGG